jgi:hypothetical protein
MLSLGASGVLPSGSDYQPNASPPGAGPFRAYLDYFTEKLVLAATGGRLTMLTQSGSGTLAGGAHADTFRQLARGHGRRISECLQKQFDKPIIEAVFPGKPVLAYFTLDFQAAPETSEIVDHAQKLSQAGYRMDVDDLSERTGYDLTEKPAPLGTAGVPARLTPGDGEPASSPARGPATASGQDVRGPQPDQVSQEIQQIRNRIDSLRAKLTKS